jgi:signal transduction histidine kinase
VRVQAGGDNIMIEVSDNGKGFILEAEGNSGGMGLENMWERAENIGANLTVLSGIGQGTTVRVAANRSTPSRQSPPEGEVPDE